MKDLTLLARIGADHFDILPADLADAIRLAARQLIDGQSAVVENGVLIDYDTVLVMATRFATDTATRDRAATVKANENRWKYLYRR